MLSIVPPLQELAAQHGPAIFPNFVDGRGFASQIVLFNDSGMASALDVRFFSTSGEPMPIPMRELKLQSFAQLTRTLIGVADKSVKERLLIQGLLLNRQFLLARLRRANQQPERAARTYSDPLHRRTLKACQEIPVEQQARQTA